MADAINDQNFDQILRTEKVVLVDFWASWCGPCRTLAPTIDQLAKGFEGKAKVLKMDVDANPHTPGRFGIRGIPTVIVFKDGKEFKTIVGPQPIALYEQILNEALG
jgi:thioredoxin 1